LARVMRCRIREDCCISWEKGVGRGAGIGEDEEYGVDERHWDGERNVIDDG
jgi:hypothetical protein